MRLAMGGRGSGLGLSEAEFGSRVPWRTASGGAASTGIVGRLSWPFHQRIVECFADGLIDLVFLRLGLGLFVNGIVDCGWTPDMEGGR